MRRGLLIFGAMIAIAVVHDGSLNRALHAQASALFVAPASLDAVQQWDNTVNQMLRTNELQVRLEREDTLILGRKMQQLDQYHQGVRIWGGGVSRQLDGGTAISVFGVMYGDPTIDVRPTLSQDDAKALIEQSGGTDIGQSLPLELVILPDDGSFRLAWVGDVFTLSAGSLRIFVDAGSGEILRRDSTTETQLPSTSYVGHGKGVLGDDKKISTSPFAGGFVAFDTIRPPAISTYDLRANLTRAAQILSGAIQPVMSDYASTGSTNDWADVAAVDAHVNSSYTYDYYYRRFGRHGLDNANIRMANIVHAVRRSDAFAAGNLLTTFWINAGYYPQGNVMYYGEGLPPGASFGGRYYDYFSGALDIVAHELTHGVTQFTSNLEYRNESGALNESFSDMMGTSVEFFIQPPGNGPLKADYLVGEDIARSVVAGVPNGNRSLENPGLYGQPDHYSKRLPSCTTVCDSAINDNGNVHGNSGIPNNVFYLSIEGGTNRTSGLNVQGVGAQNREQIEKVFYRAFAQLMPSNANFSMARAITLQAATDLYGASSAAYSAVRDAWTAVGVN